MELITTNPFEDNLDALAQVISENLKPLPVIEYEERE